MLQLKKRKSKMTKKRECPKCGGKIYNDFCSVCDYFKITEANVPMITNITIIIIAILVIIAIITGFI